VNAAVDSRYRVERGDLAVDRQRILDLWERCAFASGPRAAARFDWFYLQNPAGRGRVYLLFNGDELVGSLGAGSRLIACGRDRPALRAAILADFVVHPAHRSMFPALKLQRVAREHELRDAQLLYSLPGDKATPVFRRLGFSAQLSSGNHARVLHSAKFMHRLLPRIPSQLIRVVCGVVDRARLLLPWMRCRVTGLRWQWLRELPAGIEDLWSRAGTPDGVAMGVRHRQFLEWRFDPTLGEWRVLAVSDRRGGLVGYFICLCRGDHLWVYDLLLADRHRGTVPLLALALAAWGQGVNSVRVLFGGSPHMQRALARAGYRLRDQRTCFLIQPPDADARQLPEEWWLTKADEDA
jgi:hypothetical protein